MNWSASAIRGLPIGARHAVKLCAEHEIFKAGERAIGGNKLRDIADAAADFGGGFHDVESRDKRSARGWREKGGEHFYGGGFAGAVGAEEAEDLAARNTEIDRVNGGDGPVTAREVECLDGVGGLGGHWAEQG